MTKNISHLFLPWVVTHDIEEGCLGIEELRAGSVCGSVSPIHSFDSVFDQTCGMGWPLSHQSAGPMLRLLSCSWSKKLVARSFPVVYVVYRQLVFILV